MKIVFANGKGGVGKTTTACHLAAALAQSSLDASLIDLDPQQSATELAELYELKLNEKSKYHLIDTAPRLIGKDPHAESIEAIRNADLVVIVTTPHPLDLKTTVASAQLIKDLRKGPTRVLFNLVEPETRLAKMMDDIIGLMPFPCLQNVVEKRMAYKRAPLHGLKEITPIAFVELQRVALEILNCI